MKRHHFALCIQIKLNIEHLFCDREYLKNSLYRKTGILRESISIKSIHKFLFLHFVLFEDIDKHVMLQIMFGDLIKYCFFLYSLVLCRFGRFDVCWAPDPPVRVRCIRWLSVRTRDICSFFGIALVFGVMCGHVYFLGFFFTCTVFYFCIYI